MGLRQRVDLLMVITGRAEVLRHFWSNYDRKSGFLAVFGNSSGYFCPSEEWTREWQKALGNPVPFEIGDNDAMTRDAGEFLE